MNVPLTPEQIAVLRLIREHGIEAPLVDEQWDIRDDLEEMDLICSVGYAEDGDLDYVLTGKGKTALNFLHPNWWIAERQKKVREIKSIENALLMREERDDPYIIRLHGQIDSANENLSRYRAVRAEQITRTMEALRKARAELEAWEIENKEYLPA